VSPPFPTRAGDAVKLLWLSQFVPYPPVGGALQRSYHLLRHAAREHEVHLLALNQPRLLGGSAIAAARDALGAFCGSVTVLPLPSEASRLRRAATRARAVLGSEAYDAVWLRSAEMARAVELRRRRGGFDLVHADTVGLWPYVSDWTETPRLLVHHNIESDLVDRRAARVGDPLRGPLLRREAAKLRALERVAAAEAAVNVVVSERDRGRLLALAPGARVEVVDNGVDTGYWRPSSEPTEEGSLVFAGTLGWYPNRDAVDFLLGEIWPRLGVGGSRRHLYLVGRDPPGRARRARDARVTVTGAVPDARPFLARASVYLCPIRVGGGSRLKVLDALAMAKPLVATRLAVEGLDLVPGVHYLPAETAEDFVRQIEALENDPAARRALGDAGRTLVVERYDWAAQGPKLAAAYARAARA
jgi:glycosyltransferase involved in cell wall biosynthesis